MSDRQNNRRTDGHRPRENKLVFHFIKDAKATKTKTEESEQKNRQNNRTDGLIERKTEERKDRQAEGSMDE